MSMSFSLISAGAADPTWNPAGWSQPDAIGWDELMHYAGHTLDVIGTVTAHSRLSIFISFCFMVTIAVAIGRLVLDRLAQ